MLERRFQRGFNLVHLAPDNISTWEQIIVRRTLYLFFLSNIFVVQFLVNEVGKTCDEHYSLSCCLRRCFDGFLFFSHYSFAEGDYWKITAFIFKYSRECLGSAQSVENIQAKSWVMMADQANVQCVGTLCPRPTREKREVKRSSCVSRDTYVHKIVQ